MRLLVIILLVVLGFGCASPNAGRFYTPNMIKTESTYLIVPPFESNEAIHVEGIKKNIRNINLGEYNHWWDADAKEWTDCAVLLLSNILRERGVRLNNNSSKYIKISVRDVNLNWEFDEIRCSLTLYVETGNNYKRSIKNIYFSPDLYDSCNGALISAICSLFTDRSILAYILPAKREQ